MASLNPYEPSTGSGSSWPANRAARPPVWPWYVAYCVLMGLLYTAALFAGGVLVAMADAIAAEDPDMTPDQARVMGVILAVISLPLAALFFAGPLLPKRNFAWVYGIVAIALGMTSACCLPVAIPLLIYWVKPETKAYFQNG